MANLYYNTTYSFSQGTKANGTEVKAEIDAIAAGFDLLPAPSVLASIADIQPYVDYATEWAIAVEDLLVSAAAGGNQISDYSALHHAAKAAASAASIDGAAVAITGGTIDGTPIGGTTPAAGDFTALSATGDIITTGNIATTGGIAATGDITTAGTVDGRDVAADGIVLDAIEPSADVTDAANVTAAGALMDSEVDADIKTLVLPASTTISSFGASLIDDTSASNARTTLALGSMSTQASTAVDIDGGTIDGAVIDGRDVGTDGALLDTLSRRNQLLDGSFDIWQRGVSFTSLGTASAHTADMWEIDFGSGSNDGGVTQSTFALGQTDVPNNPAFYASIAQTSANAATTNPLFYQRMRGVGTFAGLNATVSFWAKSSTSLSNLRLRLRQNFGTGGSPSASVTTTSADSLFALSTAWQKFTYTFAVPSISGKTLGTDANDFLELGFEKYTDTTAMVVDFAQVQFESGSTATLFESRHIVEELALCKGYYERIGGEASGVMLSTIGGRSTSTATGYFYFSEKWTVPSITTVGTNFALDGLGGEALSSLTYASIGKSSAGVTWTDSGTVLNSRDAYTLRTSNANSYIEVEAAL